MDMTEVREGQRVRYAPNGALEPPAGIVAGQEGYVGKCEDADAGLWSVRMPGLPPVDLLAEELELVGVAPSLCRHPRLHQVSEAVLRTTWERQEDGTYEPDAENKVLHEEVGTFMCVDCKTEVSLDGETAKLEEA